MATKIEDEVREVILSRIRSATINSEEKKEERKPETPLVNEKAKESSSLLSIVHSEASDDKQLFSTLFGISPAQVQNTCGGPDFLVRTYKKKVWPEEVIGFIPEVREHYTPNITAAYSVLMGWQLNDNVMIYGPPGAGKTSLIEHLCGLLNIPFIRVVGRDDMETGPMLGTPTVKGGTLGWSDGLITLAARHGGCVLCDEPWLIPPGIMMGLNSLLEDKRSLVLTDCPSAFSERVVKVNPDLFVAFCDNTGGQGDLAGRHAGVNVQNTASLDRFSTNIMMDYMSAADELKMVSGYTPELNKKYIQLMIKMARLVRTAYTQGDLSLTMSPRTLISWARKTVLLGSIEAAFKVAFLVKFVEDTERAALENMYLTVFGD